MTPPISRAFRAFCASLFLCAAACRPAAPEGPAVEKVVEEFYADHFVTPYYGVPDSARLAGIRPFITDSLARLLAVADSLRAADIARAPDEKPRWVDGDIFTSLIEGPSAFYIKPAIRDGDVVKVPMAFRHQEKGDTAAVEWVDTAIVVSEGGRPVVADIRFGGTWAFGRKGTLVGVLQP
jgi:hypothetical protein